MTDADRRACRELLRHGSKSFHAASLLLPPRVRHGASALYAFCRVADNAVDDEEPGATADSVGAVDRLERRLEAVYGDGPLDGPVDRAFRSVVSRNAIPRAIPAALLEGLRWDEQGRTYRELTDLYDYAVRVGSTVGVMMTLVMGRRDATTLAAAAELGMAMQLTNIARDVGEDARRGRIYLPIRRLEEAGVNVEAWLEKPRFEPGIDSTVAWLLDDADRLYARSWEGISRLPAPSRPAIRAAALLYAEIGNEIRKAGLDSVSRRAWTSPGTKFRILSRAVTRSSPPKSAFPGAARGSGRVGSAHRSGGTFGTPLDSPTDAARASAAGLVSAAANFQPGAGYEDRP